MRNAPDRASFNATIDLLAQHLDGLDIPDTRSVEALEAVRASVSSMPGAGWVDVAYQGRIPPSLLDAAGDRWITLYRPWNAVPLEVGVPGYEAVQWYGMIAPAATPKEVVARLHKGVVFALQDPGTRERLVSSGAEPVGSTPEEFAALMRAEVVKWAKVVKAAGIARE